MGYDFGCPRVARVLVSVLVHCHNVQALCVGPLLREAAKEEMLPANGILQSDDQLFGFCEDGAIEGAFPGVGEIAKGAYNEYREARFVVQGSEQTCKEARLFVTPILVCRTQDPVPVILQGRLAGWAACRHVCLALAETESNGKEAVDKFNDELVFGDAERADCYSMGVPMDGVEGGLGPAVAFKEVR